MARKSATVTNIEYVAARAAFAVLGVLPRRFAIRVCMWIMWAASHLIGGLRRTGRRNLEIAFPEKTPSEREAILAGTFDNLGRVLGELSHMKRYDREDFRRLIDFEFDEETLALYESFKTSKRGVLITTGHMGNWEMLVLGFAALYEPISFLARPLDNRKIDDMLTERRTRFGNTAINKTGSMMKAIKILSDGGLLGILSDVNSQHKSGVFVPFFGVPACTAVGAALMAIRSNSLIYPTFCVWNKETQRYKFIHGRLIEPTITGDLSADILKSTADYTAEIESIIRQYPDQWMWIHKRWKTRPPGEPGLY
jgi:Kdo2-lipid IVA lauroyltransferase/acyltransferase